MEKVPSLFLVIPTIVSLDLSHNCLKYLPRGIKQLTRLEYLNLSHNQLAEVTPPPQRSHAACVKLGRD
jgi:Leucine-rich repeat (LRR) protein